MTIIKNITFLHHFIDLVLMVIFIVGLRKNVFTYNDETKEIDINFVGLGVVLFFYLIIVGIAWIH